MTTALSTPLAPLNRLVGRASRRTIDMSEAQSQMVDRLKDLGVTKFRRRYLSLGGSEQEIVGFLGDLRFVICPQGSIKIEGYVDPDKAVALAKLYQ